MNDKPHGKGKISKEKESFEGDFYGGVGYGDYTGSLKGIVSTRSSFLSFEEWRFGPNKQFVACGDFTNGKVIFNRIDDGRIII